MNEAEGTFCSHVGKLPLWLCGWPVILIQDYFLSIGVDLFSYILGLNFECTRIGLQLDSIDPVFSLKLVHQLGVNFNILFRTRSLAPLLSTESIVLKFYDMLNYTSIVQVVIRVGY